MVSLHPLSRMFLLSLEYTVTGLLSKRTVQPWSKLSSKFYKTTLPADMIFTKEDVSTSDEQVEKLTREYNIHYRACIGSLIYIFSTRVDLSFAVHKLAKFSANPGKVHFEGLVNLLRYIRDNKPLGLKYYAPVLIPVSGQSCQLEPEKYIKWLLVLIMDCLKRSVTGASFRSAYYFRPNVLLSLIYINRCTNLSKCTLPGFAENFSNLCTAKLKSALVDNR